ncbi:serine hydrolase domain-containing protein [Hymenobacter chitinivorans]|uniref:CubicO group peptidase (Beta-lactamase class C family) n=1 Tax=Hymenobacter chitinivorans DSM 11115 TaxID=1121954 RepID=A0A2M9BQF1_9BACT|nr:serine hydrolase [Hymenobacter chitinivorans]PJJ60184.1 CubicO group peptidase (beta-lactamase class C family) [Hymenobacter chitinivorans DSM 11115]
MKPLRSYLPLLLLLPVLACSRPTQPTAPGAPAAAYYPGPGNRWQRQKPEKAGFDAARLQQAVAWAQEQETTQMTPNFATQAEIFGTPLGPLPASRAATNGLILRHGYIVAEWGNTEQADPTYSVAKSVLSTLLGLTLEKGLIKDIHDPVSKDIHDGGYDSDHNRRVTWEHHVRQSSEWEGSMWGKNADFVGHEAFGKGERKPRTLQEPGTYYEYNDVRINRFSLSLLELWRRPLPEVFRSEIMQPIGASSSWQWVPYRNSTVLIDGQPMASVSGGTRWGGGLWISSRDEARFGYLFLRQGRWQDRQVVPAAWVQQATTPGGPGPDYGYLWWLNSQRKAWPDAPATSYAALGAGSNTIWVDPEHDLVIVWRWHNGSPNELIKRVLGALKNG